MNRRLPACCAALVLLTVGCGDPVSGTPAEAEQPGGLGSSPFVASSFVAPQSPQSPQSSGPSASAQAPTEPTEPAVPSEPTEPTESESATTSEPADSSTTTTSAGKKVSWELPDPPPDPPRNSYGDIAAEPGQSYSVVTTSDEDAAPTLMFRVEKLVLDPKCADPEAKPKNGHLLLIELQVEAHSPDDEQLEDWTGTFSPSGWTVFDAKGSAAPEIESDPADECQPDQRLPYFSADDLEDVDGVVSGVVVLDVPTDKGTALLNLNTGEKWEFGYPG